MASAGRILILPKGIYDSTKEYEMLDLVFHGGTSWVAKKSSVGVEPSDANDEFWFKMCEATDLTEINNRLAALENQMLSAISLDDIDLSGYATKAELVNYAAKSDINTINNTLTSLDSRLDTAEPKISTLVSDVSAAETNISNLQNKVNNLPTSAKTEIKTYTGNGKSGSSNPCSVTFSSIVPKIIMVIGWKQNNGHQVNMQSGGYRYNVPMILCDELTTSYSGSVGFMYCDSASTQPARYAKKSSDGKTIYWYIEGDGQAQAQINQSDYKYYILGIA